MEEKRFGILVGINDYKSRKLSFCDKDVEMLTRCLINSCRFEVGNIFPIVSSSGTPIVNVYEVVLRIINDIKDRFNPTIDSLLFYFSGHGRFEAETVLEFHDQQIKVQEIYNTIIGLEAKRSVIILDACHSGFGIEVKNSIDGQAITEYYNQRYIAASEGLYFLCSCKQDEKSRSYPRYNSSVYTKYICDAINNGNLYDKETGAITLLDIHQYAAKKNQCQR